MTNDEKKTTEQPDCRQADETLTGSGYGEPSIWY